MDFLNRVAAHIADLNRQEAFKDREITLILPTKRSHLFFRKAWAAQQKAVSWVPETTTFDRWISRLSGLEFMDPMEQLLFLHQAFNEVSSGDPVSVDTFAPWGSQLCRDFEEIERYMVNRDDVFASMSDIEKLNQWMRESANDDAEIPERYLQLWSRVGAVYKRYRALASEAGKSTQGLAFRDVAERVAEYAEGLERQGRYVIFAGFNAVSRSEAMIIQGLMERGLGDALWDFDQAFTQHPTSDAGLFIRSISNWPVYRNRPLAFRTDDMNSSPKKVHLHQVGGKLEQAFLLPDILSNVSIDERTAVVLADEKILPHVLMHLPDDHPVNVTMGYPVMTGPVAEFFVLWLQFWLHPKRMSKRKDLLAHPIIHNYFSESEWADVLKWLEPAPDGGTAEGWMRAALHAMSELRIKMESLEAPTIELEMLYGLWKILNRLQTLLSSFPQLSTNPRVFQKFLLQMLQGERLDFLGEPLEGIQVMGLLETRALDFDRVILLSANEGTLPKGRQYDSSLPFDIKKHYGLPTFLERDAVFAYHFYRLISRASEVHLLYSDVTQKNGERSRFIQQLELDYRKNPHYQFATHTYPKLAQLEHNPAPTYTADPWALQQLELWSKKISASSLKKYLKDPREFYIDYVLHAREPRETREEMGHDVFGNIVHDALKSLYGPAKGQVLSREIIEQELRPRIDECLQVEFKKHFKPASELRGYNFLRYQLAEFRLHQALQADLAEIEAGKKLEILELEEEFSCEFHLSDGRKVVLSGTIDRVDRVDDQLRIMDYKTGNAAIKHPKNLLESGFKDHENYLQVGIYLNLYLAQNPHVEFPVHTRILSFKKYDERSSSIIEMTREHFDEFNQALRDLIEEILDAETAFNPPKSNQYSLLKDVPTT